MPQVTKSKANTLHRFISALHSFQQDFSAFKTPNEQTLVMFTYAFGSDIKSMNMSMVFNKDGSVSQTLHMCSLDERGLNRYIKELESHATSTFYAERKAS